MARGLADASIMFPVAMVKSGVSSIGVCESAFADGWERTGCCYRRRGWQDEFADSASAGLRLLYVARPGWCCYLCATAMAVWMGSCWTWHFGTLRDVF